jgi:hypothetical protein
MAINRGERGRKQNEMKGILKALWPGCDYKGKFGGNRKLFRGSCEYMLKRQMIFASENLK